VETANYYNRLKIIYIKQDALYGALTRWGYTNTHITVYDTVPKLSGKVEYERESLTH
jgi:hypothetical protein